MTRIAWFTQSASGKAHVTRSTEHFMASLPEPIIALTAALSRLPGIGPRSAERLALHLVQSEAGSVRSLAEVILAARSPSGSRVRCAMTRVATPRSSA